MTNTYDPGGTFLIADEIAPPATAGTPVGFDLTTLLSENMRRRQPWFDMAVVASNILYQYCETSRISLEMSRDSTYLGRTLKIALLSMMGLNWNSVNLTDDAYDRVIASISLYNAGHGPVDFVQFMGYALDVPLDMVDLWTSDYKTFYPGPPVAGDTIFSNPSNLLAQYPTTHVGLLYEEFATNAANLDLDELKQIFYKMAPINLVLEWIAAEVTLRVGPLIMALNFYETETATLSVSSDRILELYLRLNSYEGIEYQTLLCAPFNPQSAILLAVEVGGVDSGTDYVNTVRPGADWSIASDITTSIDVGSSSDYVICRTSSGDLTTVRQPAQNWVPPWNASIVGGLSRPGRKQYVPYSHDVPPWDGGTVGTAVVAFADGLPCPVVTAPDATPYVGYAPEGTHCVALTFAPVESGGLLPKVSLSRGTDVVSYNCATMTLTPGASGAPAGILALGSSGFFTLWAQMTGSDVRVSTQVGAVSPGSISWYNINVTDGGFPDLPTLASGTVPLKGYTSTWAITSADTTYLYGFILVRATLLFPEWTFSDVTLLDVRTPDGLGIYVDIDSAGGIGFTAADALSTSARHVLETASDGVAIGVCVSWDSIAKTITVTVNGTTLTVDCAWPANLREVGVCRPINSLSEATWVIHRILAYGYSVPENMPEAGSLLWLTQNA